MYGRYKGPMICNFDNEEVIRQALEGLKEALAEVEKNPSKLLDALKTDDLSEPGGSRSTHEYQGFDVSRVKELLRQRHGKLRAGLCIPIGNKNVPITLPFLIDFLVGWYNYKGNNLSQIETLLPDMTRSCFSYIIATFQLRSKVTVPDDPKCPTLTLGRIAAAFPIRAVVIATHRRFDHQMIDLSDVGVDQKTALGKGLAHKMAANVLTIDLKKKELPFVTFLTVNRRNALKEGKQKRTMANLWSFHKAALDSTAASEQAKEALWANLGQPSTAIVAPAKAKLTEMGMSAELMAEIALYCANAAIPVPSAIESAEE